MSVDDEDPIKVEDVSKPNFDAQNVQLNEPYSFSPKDLVSILRSIKTVIFYPENQIRDEAEKRKKFRTDDSWEFTIMITSFLVMLLEQKMLTELV